MGRNIRTLALFLLAGAGATVAVAWVCAALVVVEPGAVGFTSGTRVARVANEKWSSVYECKALGTRRLVSFRDTDFYFDYTTTVMVDEAGLWPSWARRTGAGRSVPFDVHDARGLPLQAMSCEIMSRGGGTWSRDLPLRPIWPGFAADSMFYAGILMVSIRGAGAVRRFVRNKSGRCVACGYDLRGNHPSNCPECGS